MMFALLARCRAVIDFGENFQRNLDASSICRLVSMAFRAAPDVQNAAFLACQSKFFFRLGLGTAFGCINRGIRRQANYSSLRKGDYFAGLPAELANENLAGYGCPESKAA